MGITWPWKRHQETQELPDELELARAAAEAVDIAEAQDSSEQRVRLKYAGRVQGVGFRFQMEMLARACAVSGWVKNLDDGAVLLEIQGTPQRCTAFQNGVVKLTNNPSSLIDAHLVSCEHIPCVHEKGFRVQY